METTETKPYEPLVALPLKKGAEPLVLDEAMYNTIDSLLCSRDAENVTLAQMMLVTCDIKKSIYWLYKLANDYPSAMINLRTKAGRFLSVTIEPNYLYRMKETKFASWVIDKGWMTPELFSIMEPDLVAEIKEQVENPYYDVKIQLKDDYKHLSLNPVEISFKEETDEKISDL